MANSSRWGDIKKQRPGPTSEGLAAIDRDFAPGELIHELRTGADTALDRRVIEGA